MQKMKVVLMGAALCTAAASVQFCRALTSPNAESDPPAASPAAYVYVAGGDITAYSAAPNGQLTHIPGSPFSASVDALAGNGKYLFASTTSTTDIESYAIESNGALSYIATENVVKPDGGCGNANELFLDHSGSTVYTTAYFGNECTNNTYEAFTIENSTGKLQYLGIYGDTESIEGPFTLIGNNQFAYAVGCYHYNGSILPLQRNSNGSLKQLSFNIQYPEPDTYGYCGYAQAADPSNHVAVAMQAFNDPGSPTTGIQLGTYTAASNGNMTTTSTHANMPTVSVGNLTVMNMAPSGKLLAVAGSAGLEVYHFNGASPITRYTGLLTTAEVDAIHWDNANHLYAIGYKANKLWVFTVTPTGFSQAPGSPYTVSKPEDLKVLPL